MKYISVVVLLFFFNISAFGQSKADSLEYGNVSVQDLEMSVYGRDSSANALILLDDGEVGFDPEKGMVFMDYHGRIKIFNSDAFYLADLMVPYAVKDGLTIEGVTHSLENGEHKKTHISPDQIVTETVSEGLYTMKTSFPSIDVGVVIEYKYRVYGFSAFEFFPWFFQSTLPVKLSEFRLDVPGAFALVPRLYGYNELSYYDDGREEPSWHTLRMENLPALEAEPYVNKIDDHYSKVSFEPSINFANDWKGLNEIILDVKGFGETIDKHRKINKFYPSEKEWAPDVESLRSIHAFIADHFDWNEQFGLIFSSKPRELWKRASGSSADLNLILLMFLKRAGFEASPVFMSTISNGLVNPEFVTYGQFNNIVVHVKLEDKEFLLDATSKLRPFNVLPDEYLNGKGLIIKKGEPSWISMNINSETVSEILTSRLTIDGDIIVGKASSVLTSSAGTNLKILLSGKNDVEITESIELAYEHLQLDSIKFEGLENPYENLMISFNFEAEDAIESIEDKLFFKPLLFKEIETNPFKLQERVLPIEFVMPIKKKYVFQIDIPEDYKVLEAPKSIRYVLPNGVGEYSYQSQETGSELMILVKFNINKLFFIPEEYESLREIFNQIIFKQQEQVVLVKAQQN